MLGRPPLPLCKTISQPLGTCQKIFLAEGTLSNFRLQKVDFSTLLAPANFGPQGAKIELECPTKGSQTPKTPFRGPGNSLRPIGLDSDRFWQNSNFRPWRPQKSNFRPKFFFFCKNLRKNRKFLKIIKNRFRSGFGPLWGHFWPGWIFKLKFFEMFLF